MKIPEDREGWTLSDENLTDGLFRMLASEVAIDGHGRFLPRTDCMGDRPLVGCEIASCKDALYPGASIPLREDNPFSPLHSFGKAGEFNLFPCGDDYILDLEKKIGVRNGNRSSSTAFILFSQCHPETLQAFEAILLMDMNGIDQVPYLDALFESLCDLFFESWHLLFGTTVENGRLFTQSDHRAGYINGCIPSTDNSNLLSQFHPWLEINLFQKIEPPVNSPPFLSGDIKTSGLMS